MVGNFADAQTAHTRFMAGDWTDLLSPNGTTRMVWLINDVVYKCGDSISNDNEYDMISNTRHVLPQGFYYPEVSLFDVDGHSVVAMEYIDGIAMAECYCFGSEVCDTTCAPSFVVDVMHSLGLDSGGANVIDCEGAYYIIDAG